MEIIFFPSRGSNPVRWTQSPTLYRVAIKACLYRKAVQVCYIPIPGDILPLQVEILPQISRSPRITWNETQGVLCTHVGYLRWAPNVTVEKIEITFFPSWGSNPVRWTQSPTLYRVAIKAGLSCKAVQVCYIPIPSDNKYWDRQAWANSVDPDQMPQCGIWSGPTLFATHAAIFWTHQQVRKFTFPNFRTNMVWNWGVPILRVKTVSKILNSFTCPPSSLPSYHGR